MKINELIKIGERDEEYAVIIPAEYDGEGNVVVDEHTEIKTRTVAIMQSRTREMTPEEEAQAVYQPSAG